MPPTVIAVSGSAPHSFSKPNLDRIRLIRGLGVDGDTHAGRTVQHRSRVARDPAQPNLRQVHLIHAELLDELRAAGFAVDPGDMGENITTRGIEILALPTSTRLSVGPAAVIEVTGLRNPCVQLNDFQPGLMSAVLDRNADGELIRKSGIMGVVVQSGEVRPGDRIRVERPAGPSQPLRPV